MLFVFPTPAVGSFTAACCSYVFIAFGNDGLIFAAIRRFNYLYVLS